MATSYSNPGGSSVRWSYIEMTSDAPWAGVYQKLMLDGSNGGAVYFSSASSVVDKYIKFKFPISVVIDESTWVQDNARTSGTWRWQGSDNDTDWTNIGSTFVLGAASATTVMTELNGNTTAYQYYRMLGVANTFQNQQYIGEITFKIEAYTTSYFNTLSTGDRTAIITVTNSGGGGLQGAPNLLVNGVYTTGVYWGGVADVSNFVFKFDFGVGNSPAINEAKWFQNDVQSHGTWQWSGSNNDSSWTTIGNGFTLGGALIQIQTQLNGNAIGYRYYKLYGITGNNSNIPYLSEIIFSIGVDNSVITLKYRTGATSELCAAATYVEYTEPFDSEGFVQLRVEG